MITLLYQSKSKSRLESFSNSMLLVITVILVFGSIMIFSASIGVRGEIVSGFGILVKHLVNIIVGFVIGFIASKIPLNVWRKFSKYLLAIGVLMLALVVVPNVGHEVNGSSRWFSFGSLRFQPSELIKVFIVIYLADYFCQNADGVRSFRVSILNPSLIVGFLGVLLLLEPDFGCTAVILCVTLGMMFLAGTPMKYIGGAVFVAGCAILLLIMISPYRLDRVMSFLDPWADPYGSGFQLVQALIALGSGEWFGVGLGSSVQKLFYLPHASNDFIVAVVGEELGLVGVYFLLATYIYLIWCVFKLGQHALRENEIFGARLAQGIGLLIGIQVILHFAVNFGLVPTKGLNLPLMSYGGSSMLSTGFALGLLISVSQKISRISARSI